MQRFEDLRRHVRRLAGRRECPQNRLLRGPKRRRREPAIGGQDRTQSRRQQRLGQQRFGQCGPELVDRWCALEIAVPVRIEPARHARSLAGLGERVDAVDQQGRRPVHAGRGRSGRGVDHLVSDGCVGRHEAKTLVEQRHVGALRDGQYAKLHRDPP
ncbi:hypothetical protein [Fodinicola feengrottensis]|uniref:hypothetical protein n=1 Tax=Fodinicola feengrottensis TaxID=435914 RepID=UPI00244322D7|nr:hypothetical protein [Fodinicola feengrottensis]